MSIDRTALDTVSRRLGASTRDVQGWLAVERRLREYPDGGLPRLLRSFASGSEPTRGSKFDSCWDDFWEEDEDLELASWPAEAGSEPVNGNRPKKPRAMLCPLLNAIGADKFMSLFDDAPSRPASPRPSVSRGRRLA